MISQHYRQTAAQHQFYLLIHPVVILDDVVHHNVGTFHVERYLTSFLILSHTSCMHTAT